MPETTISPSEALERLKAGNQRFVQNKQLNRDLLMQVKQTANGQQPFAAILGCIDSRAVPELIFDQGIGDLFIVRVAGNVINEDVLGSLEFACTAGTRLILVKGHTNCGAVTGACKGGSVSGNLKQLLNKISPAIEKAKDFFGKDQPGMDFINEVSHLNVLHSIVQIKEQSPVLKELFEQGRIDIVGAMYDVTTGKVLFF